MEGKWDYQPGHSERFVSNLQREQGVTMPVKAEESVDTTTTHMTNGGGKTAGGEGGHRKSKVQWDGAGNDLLTATWLWLSVHISVVWGGEFPPCRVRKEINVCWCCSELFVLLWSLWYYHSDRGGGDSLCSRQASNLSEVKHNYIVNSKHASLLSNLPPLHCNRLLMFETIERREKLWDRCEALLLTAVVWADSAYHFAVLFGLTSSLAVISMETKKCQVEKCSYWDTISEYILISSVSPVTAVMCDVWHWDKLSRM